MMSNIIITSFVHVYNQVKGQVPRGYSSAHLRPQARFLTERVTTPCAQSYHPRGPKRSPAVALTFIYRRVGLRPAVVSSARTYGLSWVAPSVALPCLNLYPYYSRLEFTCQSFFQKKLKIFRPAENWATYLVSQVFRSMALRFSSTLQLGFFSFSVLFHRGRKSRLLNPCIATTAKPCGV